MLNCLRVLQRVLPILFDVQGESNAFELELLWKNEEVDDIDDSTSSSAPSQFVIEDEDDSDSEGPPKTSAAGASPNTKPKKKLPSLAEKLFNNLIDLMFCCGFTLSPKIQVDHHKISYVIWYAWLHLWLETSDFSISQILILKGNEELDQHQMQQRLQHTITTRPKSFGFCSSCSRVKYTCLPALSSLNPRFTHSTLCRGFRGGTC